MNGTRVMFSAVYGFAVFALHGAAERAGNRDHLAQHEFVRIFRIDVAVPPVEPLVLVHHSVFAIAWLMLERRVLGNVVKPFLRRDPLVMIHRPELRARDPDRVTHQYSIPRCAMMPFS
jgi:hypothetical protein